MNALIDATKQQRLDLLTRLATGLSAEPKMSACHCARWHSFGQVVLSHAVQVQAKLIVLALAQSCTFRPNRCGFKHTHTHTHTMLARCPAMVAFRCQDALLEIEDSWIQIFGADSAHGAPGPANRCMGRKKEPSPTICIDIILGCHRPVSDLIF